MSRKTSRKGSSKLSTRNLPPLKKNVVLDGPRSRNTLRIATLGWAPSSDTSSGKKKRAKFKEYQPVSDFLDVLECIMAKLPRTRRADLMLCAGYPVSGIPNEKRLSEALDGSSVLFEKGKGGGPWLLGGQIGGRTRIVTVRKKQLAYRAGDPTQSLLNALGRGEGILRFADLELSFALLICGENNVLRYDGRSSVFHGKMSKQSSEAFEKPWIVLNPAHIPYYPPIRAKGYAKVGVIKSRGKRYSPTMKQAVDVRVPYSDGTTAPVAFIHSNNLSGDRWKETGKHSSVVFLRTKKRVREINSLHEEGVWKFDLYEISRKELKTQS